ncbi:SDR family oxidoreductase [Microbacterium sp. STN6]|uniref:SDR family oxidoreductase n=1 Tax=Microbacterium sp. STN6 TaxID=2995588 RepID=UPI002260CCD1|nr:SDR family oxidoreductase [Microbacterium sp. STN6]MCX7522164.1 SDR family oxidoreductase [Microbacterium sp. STN6]
MSRIAIVGAHGLVAQQLMRVLYDRFDEFVGIVRNPEHADDVYRLGGSGVVLDVEKATADELADAFAGCTAVVFSAGAGAGSGVERKRTVDFGGSVLAQAAARTAGIHRFVQVSAWGVDEPVADDADEVWRAYVEAKRDADAELRASGLQWTILRPGTLTNEPGTGHVELGAHVARGSIPRADVAALIVAALDQADTVGRCWEATSGNTPIAEALWQQVSKSAR